MLHSYLKDLTDDELIASLRGLCDGERRNIVVLLRHLQEMEKRRLAEQLAFDSLFDYCLKELGWAEGETARRIHVARAALEFPVLLGAIRRKLLNVTTAALLAPHLKRENYSRLIRRAYGQRTRAVEALVATIAPREEPKERVRFLGVVGTTAAFALDPLPRSETGESAKTSTPDGDAPAPVPPAPQRVHFSFTADECLLTDVERAKELLRSRYAAPDLEVVFKEAVKMMLERLDPDRRRTRERSPVPPDPGEARSRLPPAWVKRAVWRRDGGHCAFRGKGGRLCRSRSGLQFDHIVPWALGGRSDDPANIRLLCRTHNRLEARRSLGDGVVDAALAAARERMGRRDA